MMEYGKDRQVSVSVEKHAILMSLQPLFEEAETSNRWFFHESVEAGQIWCSPEYLRLQQSKGEYVWAPEHWELRRPLDYMHSLRLQAETLVKEFNDLSKRFGYDKALKLSEVASSESLPEKGA